MRFRQRDLTTVYLKKRITTRNLEGDKITSYSADPIPLQMNVQSAGGQTMAQLYGERLPYIKTCKYQGVELAPIQNEGDGICLYAEPTAAPDYKIKSIQPFSEHLNVTLERL